MSTYKKFEEAFDRVYQVYKFEHDTRNARKIEQSQAGTAIETEMAKGYSRAEAICRIYSDA